MKILSTLAAFFLAVSLGAQTDSLEATALGNLEYLDVINDVWGYEKNGREFALVGVNSGFSLVEVTNPTNPVEIHFEPGANSTWRDLKVWKDFAYVVHDGFIGQSDGIMVVDLTTVDSSNVSISRYFPTVSVGGASFNLTRAHNIYIDEKGVLYVFGSDVAEGGALMFDVDNNGAAPAFLGAVDDIYYHDGVARGDTLWGAGILDGIFQVVDVSDKTNPVIMGSRSTPNNFCHNIWFSDDNKTVYTTDEVKGAFVTSYDVSDLNNITELDRIQSGIFTKGQVIPHNTHFHNQFLVTSYYTSGLQIVDASQPDILVETSFYDTSPLSGDGFAGAWGAYPYLPSGNILVTDRQEGLFVIHSDYPRAAFLTLFVQDSVTGNPIINADINLLQSDSKGKSDIFGNFREGQADTGLYILITKKAGYETDTSIIKMERGVVVTKTIPLVPIGFSLNEDGLITNGLDIFPNPSNGKFSIVLKSFEGGDIEVSMQNLSGKKVVEKSLEASNGELILEPNLPAGMYLLSVKNGERVFAAERVFISVP